MNTPIWVTLRTIVVTVAWQSVSLARAQLSGTREVIREFLYPRPHAVKITGEGELHASKYVAIVSLLITTEDRDLSVAMSQNQSLRDTLIAGFTAAGISGAAINNARDCSVPQFSLMGRKPNSRKFLPGFKWKLALRNTCSCCGPRPTSAKRKSLTAVNLNTATKISLNAKYASWQSKTLWRKKLTTKPVSGLNYAPSNSRPIALASQKLPLQTLLLPIHLMK